MEESGKRAAALTALDYVRNGMIVGLGSGSTAEIFLHLLAEKIAAGLSIQGVPTSRRVYRLAQELQVPVYGEGVAVPPEVDLAVDGADEADAYLRLIKGGGGALLREKIIAHAAEQMIVIADESKQVEVLGRFPLPVEVLPFAARAAENDLRALLPAGAAITLRHTEAGAVFRTDNDNLIYDCACGAIKEPEGLAAALDTHPAVMGHGLFVHEASVLIYGRADGTVDIMRKDTSYEPA